MKQLAVGIGNSTCRIAVMEDAEQSAALVLDHTALRAPDAAARIAALPLDGVRRAGICSVVPGLTGAVHELLSAVGIEERRDCRPVRAPWFPSAYRSMETLGADRFCAALAARERYGAPVIAVDCGTATTVNVVDAGGVFLGGSIAPGVATAFRALHERTAQLPALGAGAAPLIGTNTDESIRSGVLLSARFGLEGMLAALKKQIGDDTPIILTGGNAPVLLGAGLVAPALTHDAQLLFRGIIFFLHYTA